MAGCELVFVGCVLFCVASLRLVVARFARVGGFQGLDAVVPGVPPMLEEICPWDRFVLCVPSVPPGASVRAVVSGHGSIGPSDGRSDQG